MSKKIISVLLAVVMIAAMGTVAAVNVSAEYMKTYYFEMPEMWYSNDQVTTAGIYWWEGPGAAEPTPGWPGFAAEPADAENIYKMEVDNEVTTIIWNNHFDGGDDPDGEFYTDAYQTVNIGSEYYDVGESEVYPEGLPTGEERGFDGMIYVIDPDKTEINEYSGKMTFGGEWYYYYGDGKYGTDPDPDGDSTEPTDTTSGKDAIFVNGEEAHKGDTLTYTFNLTADEVLENIQAELSYDSSVLQLNEEVTRKGSFPVIGDIGGIVFNADIDGKIKFNASDISDFYDFTNGGVVITLSFEVISATDGDADIVLEISEMNSTNKAYISKGEDVSEYTAEAVVEVTHKDDCYPEPPSSTPAPTSTTGGQDTTAATTSTDATTGSEDASGESTEGTTGKVASPDQNPTDATSSINGGNGTIQTGSVSIAVTLLVLLIAATGVMFVVRKKIEG